MCVLPFILLQRVVKVSSGMNLMKKWTTGEGSMQWFATALTGVHQTDKGETQSLGLYQSCFSLYNSSNISKAGR